jgi:hypothetical protein
MTPEITAALITMCGALASASIASAAILFAAKRVVDRKSLQVELTRALKEVQFLQHIETAYVDMYKTQHDKDSKRMVRDVIRQEKGIDTSHRLAPSKVRERLSQLAYITD